MLRNPLTTEEKGRVPELYDHNIWCDLDVMGILFDEICEPAVKDEDKQRFGKKHKALFGNISMVIEASSRFGKKDCHFEECQFDAFLEHFSSYVYFTFLSHPAYENKNFELNTEYKDNIITSEPVLYTALINILGNAFGWSNNTVGLHSYEKSGQVDDLVFASDDSRTEGDFIVFDIKDDGRGFVNSVPLGKYLEFGFRKSDATISRGYGLYFTRMSSKYLRMPIAIDSQIGETHVRVYHPTDLPAD